MVDPYAQRPGVHIGSDGLFGQHPTAMDVGLVSKPTMRGRASLSCYPTRIALPVVPSTPHLQSTASNPNFNTPRNRNRNRMNAFSSVLRGLNEFDPPNSAPPMPGVEWMDHIVFVALNLCIVQTTCNLNVFWFILISIFFLFLSLWSNVSSGCTLVALNGKYTFSPSLAQSLYAFESFYFFLDHKWSESRIALDQ